MSDYPMLISNKLHSFRNFIAQMYEYFLNSPTASTYNKLWRFIFFRTFAT